MDIRDEETLNRDERSDTLEDNDGVAPDSDETAAPPARLSAFVLIPIALGLGLLVSAGIVYQERVGGAFSEALSTLFDAGTGAGSGPREPLDDHHVNRRAYTEFLLHISGSGVRDRVLSYDVVLEYAPDREPGEGTDGAVRRMIYQASKELFEQGGGPDMPARVMKREIARRIKAAVEDDAVTAVYFTRFVVM